MINQEWIQAKAYGLSPRLEAVFGLLPTSGTAADIGTDHGKLAASLLLSGKAHRVIATDISPNSLAKTRQLCEVNGWSIECRQGDGLHALQEGEADCAAIAGIGGLQIIRILQECETVARGMTLVLQPMQKIAALRAFVRQNGYTIENEDVAWDQGRVYAALRVVNGRENSTLPVELYDEIGPILFAKREPVQLVGLRMQLNTLLIKQEQFGGGEELKNRIALLKRIERAWEEKP